MVSAVVMVASKSRIKSGGCEVLVSRTEDMDVAVTSEGCGVMDMSEKSRIGTEVKANIVSRAERL